MRFLWNYVLKPILKGTARFLEVVMRWSFTNPVAGIGVGLALLVASHFIDRPWLASTFAFVGATMISSGVTGGIWAQMKEAGWWSIEFLGNLFLGGPGSVPGGPLRTEAEFPGSGMLWGDTW